MSYVSLLADDAPSLEQRLLENHVAVSRPESKGMAETQMILVALGGGTGVAAIIAAIGSAIRKYFEGKAALEANRKVIVKYGKVEVQVTGSNLEPTLATALAAIADAHK